MSRNAPGLFPNPFTSSLIADGEWVNEVKLFTRLFAPLNRIRAATASLQQVWKAHQTAATSIPTAAWTVVPMSTIDIDPLGWGLSANGGLTIPTTGIYLVTGTAGFPGSTAGTRRMAQISLSTGTDAFDGPREDEAAGAAQTCFALAPTLAPVSAGQVVNLYQWQDSGAALVCPTTVGQRGSMTVWRVA